MKEKRIANYFIIVLGVLSLTACARYLAIFDAERCNRLGKHDEALAIYSRALAHNAQDKKVYNNIGITYYLKGDYDKAIGAFNKAVEIDPSYSLPYINRGLAYKEKVDYDRAIDDFKKFANLFPKGAHVAYYQIGYAQYKKGDLDSAIKSYSKVIELKPDEDTYNNRGICYYDRGDYDLAIAEFTQAIALAQRYYGAYVYRARCWTKKGEYDKAIAEDSAVLELLKTASKGFKPIGWNPWSTILTERGLNYFYKGEFDKAIADYDQAMRYAQDDAEIFCLRGEAWMQACAMDRAVHDFTVAVALQPRSARAYRSLAFIHASSPDGRYRNAGQAVFLAQKAVDLENVPASQEALAAAYAEQGDFTAAVRHQGLAIGKLNDTTMAKDRAEAQQRLQSYQAHKAWRLNVPCK